MTDTTPRAGAPLLGASQAQKHVTHNEALYRFDAMLCARFLDRDLSAPPSSPADGDSYLVAATGSGTWLGQDGKIAYCADGGWRFYAPFPGLVAYVADESALILFDGSGWIDYGSMIAAQNVPHIGVNTTADSVNKLSVQSEAALFAGLPTTDGGSGDMRVAVSKQSAANTATVLFQDDMSGRAEVGLAGDDDFHIKISPDGSTWSDALRIAASSGALSLPRGQLQFPATANPSADANTLDDYAEGVFPTPPVVYGESVAGTNGYSLQSGTFTKIGNRVHFEIYVRLSSLGGTLAGNVAVGPLPFTSANVANNIAICTCWSAGCSFPSGCTYLVGFISPNANYVEIFGAGSSAGSHLTQANLTSSTQFVLSGSYHV